MNDELYDRLCRTLTDYEDSRNVDTKNWEEEFYDLLVDIQNDEDARNKDED